MGLSVINVVGLPGIWAAQQREEGAGFRVPVAALLEGSFMSVLCLC